MKSKDAGATKKRNKAASELPDALAAYGESFMSMFDDYDEQQAKRHKAAESSPNSDSEPSSVNMDSSGFDEALENTEFNDRQASHASAGTSKAAAKPSSKLEAFLSSKGKGAGLRFATVAAPNKAQLLEQQQQLEQQRLLERRLKKQFLSAKVSKIFSDVDVGQPLNGHNNDAGELTPEEFAQMKREVEMLGASALDKRSAKAWKASMLAKLGAAADKAPRTPAKIGLGMAKKAKQRESLALQEAIAAGMVKAKGRGKKMRAEKAKQRDKGLMEAGPGFKNGVLRLAKNFNKRL